MITNPTGLLEMQTLWRQARANARPWLLVPDEDVNEALLAIWEGPSLSRQRVAVFAHSLQLAWTELSRGLAWF
jgi:hypothetical protein